MPDEITLEDEYGKRTRFRGVRLVSETTDTEAGDKPQWAEMDVWRTEGGAYIIHRITRYRYRHLSDECSRLGTNLIPRPPGEDDTYPCPLCNPHGVIEPGRGYGVEPRSAVDIARTPEDLIRMIANRDGTYSGLARQVLTDISEQDNRVSDLWMEEVVS